MPSRASFLPARPLPFYLCMSNGAPCIYWHRQLPPLDAEVLGGHVLEATSNRVRNSLAYRDELWESCYRNLMDNVADRLRQEVRRLGGDYAHVMSESIDSRHNDATGEAWLHGRIDYALYRRLDAETRKHPVR